MPVVQIGLTNIDLQAFIDGLSTPPTPAELKVIFDEMFRRIVLLNANTISRDSIAQVSELLETQIADARSVADRAEGLATGAAQSSNAALQEIKQIPNRFGIGEDVTGVVDGANRDFVTANPYVAGTLIVAVDNNRILYGDEYITETDPTTGEFTIALTPMPGSVVKAILYTIA